MPGRPWWLVEAGQVTAAANMALDVGLLARAIDARQAAPLVRLYRWSPPCLSVGSKMAVPAGVLSRCRARGVVVVRRSTGGGCVLHEDDLTYSVVAPDGGRGVLEAYRWVAEALIAGLAELGIQASIAEHAGAGVRARPLDCFAAPTGADLSVGGRKLCGSAQLRRQGWFLQHGSIPLTDTSSRRAELLGEDTVHPAGDGSTWLERVKPGATWEDLASALVAGFTTAWGSSPGRRGPEASEWCWAAGGPSVSSVSPDAVARESSLA